MAFELFRLFFVFGLATNGYLIFRLCKFCSSPASNRFKTIAVVQLLLNTCNIIAHGMLEVSKQNIWRTLSAGSSFLSIYFLAALMVSIAGGRFFLQRLNSKLNIVILILISSGLFVNFGRKFELCANDNCFSLNLANTEDSAAISHIAIARFYLPTMIIFCASWYHGHRKYFAETAEKHPTPNFFGYLARLGSGSAVWLFMVYGILVVDGILYFNENYEITLPNHLCRISCLDEDVYLLLSIFPVYMGHFIKKRERKPQQQLEI